MYDWIEIDSAKNGRVLYKDKHSELFAFCEPFELPDDSNALIYGAPNEEARNFVGELWARLKRTI